MKTPRRILSLALLLAAGAAQAQTTAFTYQGRLNDGNGPASGSYDLSFSVWNTASGPAQLGGTLTTNGVAVSDGLFTVTLDFGTGVFTGPDRWLEIGVRTNGAGAFFTLSPRQASTPSPYAITAGNLTGTLPAAQLSGPVPSANLAGTYSSALTLNNAANSYSGSGAELTALDADELSSGTVPDARLGANVARTNQVWLWTGNAGVDPALHFLGTIDGAPLALRAANREVLRLEGQASGYRIVAGVNASVHSASTNSAVLGGRNNLIASLAHESTIVGGLDNVIQTDQISAFIGGGARNEILADNRHAVIVGGVDNRIGVNSVITSILGGADNVIGNNVDGGLILGGFRNTIYGSSLDPGRQLAPVILGGSDNDIGRNTSFAVVLGGDDNVIGTNAAYAVILGGRGCDVADNASNALAVGRRAKANHPGAFVWADAQDADFASTTNNQFNVRAAGGVRLNGDTPVSFGSTLSQKLNLYGTAFGIGIQSGVQYSRVAAGNSFAWYAGGVHNDGSLNAGGGAFLMHLDGTGNLFTAGAVTPSSDRNAKENFVPVRPREVLEKVAALPLSEWNYKADTTSRHLGPMAQDFHAAFGVGPDDKHIATVDADGVALAAIQGLNQKVDLENSILRAENAELKRELSEIKQLLLKFSEKKD